MNQWWGYVHVNGTIQVKRYFDKMDIAEAIESPFVAHVAGPFLAENREAAIAHMREIFNKKGGEK